MLLLVLQYDRLLNDITDGLLERKHRVSLETAQRLRIAAIIVSWISCIGSLAQGSIALGK